MNHEGLAEELVKLAEHLVGGYGILFVIAFVTFLFRDFVTNYAAGLRFMFGSDFDDIVWIGGNKKARIIRQTPTKTVFHMLETDRKLVVPNTALYGLKIEKALPGANEGRDL